MTNNSLENMDLDSRDLNQEEVDQIEYELEMEKYFLQSFEKPTFCSCGTELEFIEDELICVPCFNDSIYSDASYEVN